MRVGREGGHHDVEPCESEDKGEGLRGVRVRVWIRVRVRVRVRVRGSGRDRGRCRGKSRCRVGFKVQFKVRIWLRVRVRIRHCTQVRLHVQATALHSRAGAFHC